MNIHYSEKTQFDLFTIAVSHEDQKEGLKLLNTLIKNSANVNCRGEYGKTPLIYLMIGTITTSQIDLTDTRLEYLIKKITLLIQNGADPDICTFTGRNVVCLLAIASNLWKGQVTEFTWKTLFNLLVTNKNYNKRDKLGTALEITGDTVFSKLFKEYIEEKGFLNI